MPKTFTLSPSPDQAPTIWSVRLCLVCLVALSVSLPIAWISLAKFLLFTFGLVYLIGNHWSKRKNPILAQLWTTKIVLVIAIAFAVSLLWTEADTEAALSSYIKHAKLLGILVIVSLIRTEQEARIGILAYAAGQGFLLLSSWLMFLGVPVPWSADDATRYVVFSTYLDQSIMFATAASIFWHLRTARLWPKWTGILLAALALINVLLLLEGRTGYLVALTSLSLGVMWAMPRRLRLATLVATPLIVLVALSLGSAQVQQRVTKIIDESQDYAKTQHGSVESSTGWRLNAWHRSLQAINEKPWIGHGVGAWTPAAKRFEGSTAKQIFGEGNHSNPHQEYLLWGVELGIGGLLLLLAFLVCVIRDALTFPAGIRYATLSVLAAMAVACLFNSSLYDDLMGDFLCISLGLLIALGARSKPAFVEEDSLVKDQVHVEALA
jgi:O-antigen ligase